jgi:peptidylprolyl isomerase
MAPIRRPLLILFLVALGLAFAGCGGDASESATGEGGSSAKDGVDEAWEAPAVGSTVEVPDGPPPENLVIKELEQGQRPVAKSGDEVEILYVDALYSTGEVVSLAIPGTPFHLELGARGSVPGWEKGIVGMSVGGRRELIIPAGLAGGEEAHVTTIGLVGVK